MERWQGRVALVTGASAGIGAGICRTLVKHGMVVVGCARSAHRIEALAQEDDVKSAPGKLHAIKCDLTKESEIQHLFEEIRQRFGRIDVCINNAGFSHSSTLLTGEMSQWREMLEVNILALCMCSKEAVKLMKEKNIDDGQIIQISSTGGHLLVPAELASFNFYCATKFMVQTLTEGLRRELRSLKSHIRVTAIAPGMVKTEFLKRTFGEEEKKFSDDFQEMVPLLPEDIGNAVAYILSTPPHVDVNDIIIRPVEQEF
ncbi:dehydrogenase/reductase SDR family member 11-like isoform X3 [Uloborus diversus]|uniref:dehydrogenase/reductase SDR family member 11-like isoform X3 n=1 Tax=Uloborus diversus TaxID=327109 RepID=UPI00240931DC|nr:dehydrogenase/reductase SDR family member 11-like isoform X3 [Uloborus diversus]